MTDALTLEVYGAQIDNLIRSILFLNGGSWFSDEHGDVFSDFDPDPDELARLADAAVADHS